jgi:hypothetical protein
MLDLAAKLTAGGVLCLTTATILHAWRIRSSGRRRQQSQVSNFDLQAIDAVPVPAIEQSPRQAPPLTVGLEDQSISAPPTAERKPPSRIGVAATATESESNSETTELRGHYFVIHGLRVRDPGSETSR